MNRFAVPLLVACTLGMTAWPAAAKTAANAPTTTADEAGVLDPARERLLYLGVIDGLRRDGRAHAALAHLDAFELQYPNDPQAQILRANCLAEIGDDAGAEAIYLAADKTAFADRAESGLGRLYAKRGDWAAAAEAFGKAVKRKPTDALYVSDLGMSLVHLGQMKEALFRLKQASELAPDQESIRANLALALAKAGEAEQPAAEAEPAVEPAAESAAAPEPSEPAPESVALAGLRP